MDVNWHAHDDFLMISPLLLQIKYFEYYLKFLNYSRDNSNNYYDSIDNKNSICIINDNRRICLNKLKSNCEIINIFQVQKEVPLLNLKKGKQKFQYNAHTYIIFG